MNSFEKNKIIVKELPNGDNLNINVIKITGNKPGPHVHVQSSVHGAELQGNLVIYELLRFCQNNPINGSITFVPLANPYASNLKVGAYTYGRFNPVTGHNWNRNYVDLSSYKTNYSKFNIESFVSEYKLSDNIIEEFKKYLNISLLNIEKSLIENNYEVEENKFLNIQLQKIASSADIVLDLHTGPHATRYLYSAETQKNDAKELHFPFTLLIPNEFAGAMDEACFMPWHLLKNELIKQKVSAKIDFNAFTIEQGSEERVDSYEAELDGNRILHYLKFKGVINKNIDITTEQEYSELSNYKTYYSPTSGLCEFLKSPGDHFKKDEVLAKIYRPNAIESLNEIDASIIHLKAKEDGVVINHYPSASQGKGSELFQVLTSLKKF